MLHKMIQTLKSAMNVVYDRKILICAFSSRYLLWFGERCRNDESLAFHRSIRMLIVVLCKMALVIHTNLV